MASLAPTMTVELEPVFIKALRLLHSRSKDSTAQLRKMVDEAIAARKGSQKRSFSQDDTSQSSSSTVTSGKCSYPAKPDFDEIRKQEAEKNLQQTKQELAELAQASEPKRPKLFDVLESMSKEKLLEDKPKKAEEPKLEKTKKKAKPISDSESTSGSDLGMDADDFAMDMGIACVVCRQFDVTNGNQLVECQECHNLYHQECHSPRVSSADLNDPRFVWYCSKCTKNMKKIVAKPSQKTAKSPQPTTLSQPSFPKDSSSQIKPASTTAGSTKADTVFQPFRRIDTSKSSIRDSAGKPLAGLAGMAANLSGKTSDIKPGMRTSEIQKIQKANEAAKKALEMQQLRDAKIDFGKSRSEKQKPKSAIIPKGGIAKPSSIATPAPKPASLATPAPKASSSSSAPSVSAMNADKRLQMMKKKAAAKLDGKRLR